MPECNFPYSKHHVPICGVPGCVVCTCPSTTCWSKNGEYFPNKICCSSMLKHCTGSFPLHSKHYVHTLTLCVYLFIGSQYWQHGAPWDPDGMIWRVASTGQSRIIECKRECHQWDLVMCPLRTATLYSSCASQVQRPFKYLLHSSFKRRGALASHGHKPPQMQWVLHKFEKIHAAEILTTQG